MKIFVGAATVKKPVPFFFLWAHVYLVIPFIFYYFIVWFLFEVLFVHAFIPPTPIIINGFNFTQTCLFSFLQFCCCFCLVSVIHFDHHHVIIFISKLSHSIIYFKIISVHVSLILWMYQITNCMVWLGLVLLLFFKWHLMVWFRISWIVCIFYFLSLVLSPNEFNFSSFISWNYFQGQRLPQWTAYQVIRFLLFVHERVIVLFVGEMLFYIFVFKYVLIGLLVFIFLIFYYFYFFIF